MYMLLQMQEIGIFLIKASVIIFCLFAAVLIIVAGREIWKDRKQEMKRNDTFADVFADKFPDERNRKDIHSETPDEHSGMTDLNIRKVVQEYKHWEKDYNNYRKMHGMPLVRRGGENYEDHINRKFKRGSR